MCCPDEPRDGYTLSVSDCCERCGGLSEKTVRGWLSAPAAEPDHLPSVLATSTGLRSGRSAYRVRPADLEALLARITVPAPIPLDAIRPGEAAEVFAGRSSLARRDRERHTEAVRAEVERGRLTAYVIAGATRYSRSQVEDVAEFREQEGYGFEPAPRRRASKAERIRAQRDRLLTVKDAARDCGRAVSTVRKWATEGRYGAVKRGGQWFLDEVQLPPSKTRAKPMSPSRVTVTCAACGNPTDERYASEVRKTEQRARSAGRPVLFFHRECLTTEKARVLLGHPARKKRPKLSAETRARQGAAQRATWTPERRAKQRERALQMSKRAKAGDHARRIAKMARTRYGSGLSEQDVLRGITTRRARGAARVRAAADRGLQAVELRRVGLTDEQIRSELSISRRQLLRYYARAGMPVRKHGHR
jgi:hypothetical protein